MLHTVQGYLHQGVLLRSAQATSAGVARVEDAEGELTLMAAEVVGDGLPPASIGIWARVARPNSSGAVDMYAANALADEESRLPLEPYVFTEHLDEARAAIECVRVVSAGGTPRPAG